MARLHWFWLVVISLVAAGVLLSLGDRLLIPVKPLGATIGYALRWSQDGLLDVLHARGRYESVVIYAHHAIVTVLLAVPIYILLRNHVRRSARDPSQCRRCGYNLTGNVSGVCPECGEKVDAQTGPCQPQ